jgi:hypothetical protein
MHAEDGDSTDLWNDNTTRPHNTEEPDLSLHRRENLESLIVDCPQQREQIHCM